MARLNGCALVANANTTTTSRLKGNGCLKPEENFLKLYALQVVK